MIKIQDQRQVEDAGRGREVVGQCSRRCLTLGLLVRSGKLFGSHSFIHKFTTVRPFFLPPPLLLHSSYSDDKETMEHRSGSRSRSPRRRYDDSTRDERDHRSSRQDKRPRKYDGEDDRSRSRERRSENKDKEGSSRHKRERSRSRERSRERKDKKYVSLLSTTKLHTHLSTRQKSGKSEDKKARKVEKKRAREEEEARQVAELSAYSATDNPFHDVNLGQQFRWHKKSEKERKQGLTLAESQRREALRRQEAKEELEKLNRRRAQREEEQELREEEELRMQRLQESAQMSEWLAKEGDFQLEQARKRAAIRIKEKRAKAIDFLALNLKYVNPHVSQDEPADEDDAGLEIDLDEPYNIFDVSGPILFLGRWITQIALESHTTTNRGIARRH